jgi:hypothetical protein
MGDHFDMPDHPYDDDQKQREEHAYELATYIHKHPVRHIPLRSRVRVLAHVGDYALDRLVPEVEYWLELFDWQAESNS